MPPKVKVTREDIINTAVDIVRKSGCETLNARNLAAVLNCSTQPVFSNFATMDELRFAVVDKANEICTEYINREIESGEYPAYKASGMAYIRFAKEEKELFKLLFMRDRSGETINNDDEEIKPIIKIIMNNTGLCEKSAYMMHLEMWVYVHGIATMVATSYLDWKWEDISRMLTDCYEGTRKRYMEGK